MMMKARALLLILFLTFPQAPVSAGEAILATANPLATEAGAKVLAQGGSAIDAAIAVQAVLGLVEPQSSGIGGGAFLLYYDRKAKRVQAYDGREKAPAAATADLFLKPDGEPMGFWEAVVGGRAVGVPGVIALLEKVHQEHGRLSWKELFQPAIELAEKGFEISPRLAYLIARDKHLDRFAETRSYFFNGDGTPKAAGSLLKNPDYAESLRAIAQGGAQAFYRGGIAKKIVERAQAVTENPGLISLEDFAKYEAKERPALCATYREHKVCGMPPPTSGGVGLLQMLGILSNFDLPGRGVMDPEAVHLITEAGRLAFADRNRYLADSDFVEVPLGDLLDPTYLAGRAALINSAMTLGKAEAGKLSQGGALGYEQFEPPSTTHFSIRDGQGNALSMTSSVENAFGSRLMAGGFILNNQLTDFSFRPEVEGQAIANRVEAGKRPRSSMSPTLILTEDEDFVIALGSPGGSRIIGYTLKAVIGLLDWGLSAQEAIDLPNFTNRNGATDLEEDRGLEDLAKSLESKGHEVKLRGLNSGLHAVVERDGKLSGGADRRREGLVMMVATPDP